MKNPHWAIPFVAVFVGFVIYLGWMLPLLHGATDVMAARGQLGDSFGVLNSLFSGFGFAAIIVTLWLQQKQIETQQDQIKSQEKERLEEVDERRSLFNMNAAIEAMERARSLLEDHNNDRATWIEAGRLLGHAKVFSKGVTNDAHQRVLEANKLKYRSFFSDLLKDKTAAFFYGATEPMSTNAAARASSALGNVDGRRSSSRVRQLDEPSIHSIWEAAQWPANFDDPVGEAFTDEEKRLLRFHAVGLAEYLEHRDEYETFFGELIPRDRAEPSNNQT
jgi:hypothetical protein